MILTSHRLDCFRLCMDLLFSGGSLNDFDHVVLLLNGVQGRHLRYVQSIQRDHPDIAWDTISGPRGRGAYISNLQNECVRRYPESLYFKIDEDTFVWGDWNRRLETAYTLFAGDPTLSLITPIITNNGLGCWHLLNRFPDLATEYTALFQVPITPACDGPVWINPRIAEWITRQFLDLKSANCMLRVNHPQLVRFAERFSINCICYDYRHWKELGGIPEHDEVGWGDWITRHHKPALLVTDTIAHHYSFFVQQDWLDRTSLLEDLRTTNLGHQNVLASAWARGWRVAKQIPQYLERKLSPIHRESQQR